MTATASVAPLRDALDRAEPAALQWPAPDMSILGGGRKNAPPMPPEVFGKAWPLLVDLAESAGAPVDYVAIGVLGVVASLIGGKRRVRPFETSGWDEPCILWATAVGDPSTNKSPALDAAIGPLHRMENELAGNFSSTLQDHETSIERARAERKAWLDRVAEATKEGHDTPRMPDAAVAPDDPQRRRLVIKDTTPEAVASILAGNHFGTLSFRDELAGWLSSFDRYSPGGREFWLEAYGGRPHTVDRKGSPKPLRIPFNGVTVLGGIQPEKLADCLLDASDDGLVARFIWAWPEPVPFRRPRSMPDVERLDRIYRRLESLSPRFDPERMEMGPQVLLLSDDAADMFEGWVAEQGEEVGAAASLYKGFCGKLKGMVLRVALAAELFAWADSGEGREPERVGARSLAAAIKFFEDYGKPTALRVFGDAALPPVERDAASIARLILRNKLRKFNPREHRGDSSAPVLNDTAKRDDAIRHLIEGDWLREAFERAGGSAGRTRKDYLVNPLVFEAQA